MSRDFDTIWSSAASQLSQWQIANSDQTSRNLASNAIQVICSCILFQPNFITSDTVTYFCYNWWFCIEKTLHRSNFCLCKASLRHILRFTCNTVVVHASRPPHYNWGGLCTSERLCGMRLFLLQVMVNGSEIESFDSRVSNHLVHLNLSQKDNQLDILVDNMGRVNYSDYKSNLMNEQRKGESKCYACIYSVSVMASMWWPGICLPDILFKYRLYDLSIRSISSCIPW